MSQLNNEIATETGILSQLVDNGNTAYLLSRVEALTQKDYKDICDELLAASPYLSDTVLIAFMRNTLHRPVSKTEVVLANSPLPYIVKLEIDNMNIPQHFKNIIWQHQQGMNARELLEQEISMLETTKDTLRNRMVLTTLYFKDSIPEMTDTLVEFLENSPDYDTRFFLIPYYIGQEQYSEALSAMNQLDMLTLNFPVTERSRVMDYIQLQNIILEIHQVPDSMLNSIITNYADFLIELADCYNCLGNADAQLLLEETGQYDYPEQVFLPDTLLPQAKTMKTYENHYLAEEPGELGEDLLLIYPNPADNKIIVEYSMIYCKSVEHLNLFDMQGNMMISIPVYNEFGVEEIDLSGLADGDYLVCFGSDREFSRKITIIH